MTNRATTQRWLDPSSKLVVVLAVAILGFALALRIAGLDKSVWIDEVGSYVLARSADFSVAVRGDIHPPLYYAVLRGAMVVTLSIPALRLFSTFCGVITVGLFLKPPARPAGFLAATFVACSPEMIFNSQELRQYALLNLCLALAFFSTLRLLDEPDSKAARISLLVTSLLAASTHLIALFFLGALAATLLVFQKNRPVKKRIATMSLLAPALALLLFFRFFYLGRASQITTDWWTGSVSLRGAAQAYAIASGWDDLAWLAAAAGRYFSLPSWPMVGLFAIAVGFTGWAAWVHREPRSIVALFVALFYWATLTTYSWLGVNVVIARVILPGMLPLWTSLGLGLASQPQPWIRRAGMMVGIGLALAMTIPWITRFAWQPREDLRGLSAMLRRTYAAGDVVVPLRGSLALQVYWPEFEKDTRPLAIDLTAPSADSWEKLAEEIRRHPAMSRVIVFYRQDRYFERRISVWNDMETRLRESGWKEEFRWDRDTYSIVRFRPKAPGAAIENPPSLPR